jgi:hypothetical protein
MMPGPKDHEYTRREEAGPSEAAQVHLWHLLLRATRLQTGSQNVCSCIWWLQLELRLY